MQHFSANTNFPATSATSVQETVQDAHAPDINRALREFDTLPDIAHVKLNVVKKLYACSSATVWRRVKSGLIPAPYKLDGSTIWRVGELRAAISALRTDR